MPRIPQISFAGSGAILLAAFFYSSILQAFGQTSNATLAVSTNPIAQKNETLLEFLDGSALHGQLGSIDPASGVNWKYADAKNFILFRPANLAWIRFPLMENSRSTPLENTCEFHFANGDEFYGNFISLNETEMELQTWFGGKFKTPRESVRSLRFFPKGPGLLYEGPTDTNGWNFGKNLNTKPWEYRDGAFVGNSPSTLGRDLKLPGSSRVEFDLGWKAPFNLVFSFYTDVFDGFNYNISSYMFFITPGNISLQRINTGTGSAMLGRTDFIPAMLNKNKVHLEFRGNQAENFLEVLVDGKSVNQWKDPAGWNGKGSGILFYTQTEGAAVTISNIKAAEWDGRVGGEASTNSPVGADLIYLVNRDQVPGKIISSRDGNLKIGVATNTLEIPLSRITQINLGATKTNAPANHPWEIQASISGGGKISFTLEKWNDQKVFGQNKNFGQITLDPRLIRQIRFNPSQRKAAKPDLVEELFWEANEP
ncbi:MAG: hypothetical protein ABI042_01015 [Verrucomicrobiota bacterium]